MQLSKIDPRPRSLARTQSQSLAALHWMGSDVSSSPCVCEEWFQLHL
jgi:hypothetical protein